MLSPTNSKAARPFAAFDIDGTVIRWQLYHAIVHELSKDSKTGDDLDVTISKARMTWKKRSSSDSFKQYEHTLVHAYHDSLGSISHGQYEAAVDKVFNTYKDQVYTYTRDLIKNLKKRGYLIFAISGSQQEILEKLAEYYGFDDVVGAKYSQDKAGNISSLISSPATSDKGAHLKELVKKHQASFSGSYAVGDSASDAAMLKLVENPIAFDPDKDLYDIAVANKWKIVLERKNMVYELQPNKGNYQLKPWQL